MHEPAVPTKEFENRQTDWVRTPRRSRRENAVRAVVDGRSTEQLESFGAIEDPENEQV
jgi:hypothetical protein